MREIIVIGMNLAKSIQTISSDNIVFRAQEPQKSKCVEISEPFKIKLVDHEKLHQSFAHLSERVGKGGRAKKRGKHQRRSKY